MNTKLSQPIRQSMIIILIALSLMVSVNSTARMWITTKWVVECIDPVDCEPANEILAAQLIKGSEWLKSLGFEGPASMSNLDLGHEELDYWIANVSDEQVAQMGLDFTGKYEYLDEIIWLTSDDYFNLGEPGMTHNDDDYILGNLKTVVGFHELFHAVQNANEYYLSSEDAHKWIREGTAVAAQLDYARHVEPDADAGFSTGTHTNPIHQPVDLMDNYLTAGFWLFIGTHIGSEPRIAYLKDLFRNKGLAEDSGIAGVDDFLKPHGGMFKLFPLYMAKLPFNRAFGQVNEWQLSLPSGKDEISKNFSGSVKQIAAAAGKLSVSHQSEKPVEVRIEFAGDDSDLHLIVDGTLQLNQQLPDRNVFAKQVNGQKENFELVIAEVAQTATKSKNRNFTVKVTLKELKPLPCGFRAEVGSGVPMAGFHEGPGRMLGNMVVLSDPKTGWEARVEIPAKTPGTYQTSFQATAFIVDHPNCPGCAEFWQDDDAQIEITAIDNDRKTGFVEGSFSGIAEWKGSGSTGEAKPFTVQVHKFRALKFSIRKNGAMQSCVDYWENR